jgi:hypothetical protein
VKLDPCPERKLPGRVIDDLMGNGEARLGCSLTISVIEHVKNLEYIIDVRDGIVPGCV